MHLPRRAPHEVCPGLEPPEFNCGSAPPEWRTAPATPFAERRFRPHPGRYSLAFYRSEERQSLYSNRPAAIEHLPVAERPEMRRPTEPARHVRLRHEKLRKHPTLYDRPVPGLVRTTQCTSVIGCQLPCPACER